MTPELVNTTLLGLAFLVIFIFADVMHTKLYVKAELTRKFVHFFSGFLILLFPIVIKEILLVGILCGAFMVLLFLSLRFNFFRGIHGVERKTYGSFIYPIAIFGTYIFYTQYLELSFFYIPVLILAICDPIAALVGKCTNWKPFKVSGQTKTLGGSIGFALSAFLVSIIIFYLDDYMINGEVLITCVFLAISTAISEALVFKGYDNITIPGISILALYTCLEFGLLR